MSDRLPAYGRQGLLGWLRNHALEGGALRPTGMVIVEIRNFSAVCSRYGYEAIGEVVARLESSLGRVLRPNDSLHRVDERSFALVLAGLKKTGQLRLALSRIRSLCNSATNRLDSEDIRLLLGAALSTDAKDQPEALLGACDHALHVAASAPERLSIYSPTQNDENAAPELLASDIREGLENSEFEVWYQPKVCCRTLRILGAEALMRWQSDRLGRVSPEDFIAAAIEHQLIDELTRLSLHRVGQDWKRWHKLGLSLTVAVNFAPAALSHSNIVNDVTGIATIWSVPLSNLVLEITEDGIVAADGPAMENVLALREAGMRVSIDDFGTGASSLAYFEHIPADELKIDKSFVMRLDTESAKRHMVQIIIDLAHKFEMKVVAEGVENAASVGILQEIQADYLQGYHFSPAVPADDFVGFVKAAHETSKSA